MNEPEWFGTGHASPALMCKTEDPLKSNVPTSGASNAGSAGHATAIPAKGYARQSAALSPAAGGAGAAT